jgi:hypothetical protein
MWWKFRMGMQVLDNFNNSGPKDAVDKAAEEYSYNAEDSKKDPNPRFVSDRSDGQGSTVRIQIMACSNLA